MRSPLYPAVWGLGQLLTGPASHRYGCKPFIVAGMFTQAAALAVFAFADTFTAWAAAAALRGGGTAAVHPVWRAEPSVSTGCGATVVHCRALLAGVVGIRAAVWVVAALTATSGLLAAFRMYETHPGNATPAGP